MTDSLRPTTADVQRPLNVTRIQQRQLMACCLRGWPNGPIKNVASNQKSCIFELRERTAHLPQSKCNIRWFGSEMGIQCTCIELIRRGHRQSPTPASRWSVSRWAYHEKDGGFQRMVSMNATSFSVPYVMGWYGLHLYPTD